MVPAAEMVAVALDEVTGRRVSGLMVLGVLALPLGYGFLTGFIALGFLLGGALALVGLHTSAIANIIALAAALIGAFALVVLIYRKMIVRWPWLRQG